MSRNKLKSRAVAGQRRMAWPLLLAGLGILLVVGAFVALRKPAPEVVNEVQGAPALRADRQEISLGDIRLGKTVEAAFRLSNVGDQPLRFTEPPYIEVREGC